jgi:peptide methionine sulfoxide reductase MsrA
VSLPAGCFWHVQHEFVQAERKILKRSDEQLTALAGYAGGNAGSKGGKVCYHNALQVADYGSLGHAEVVRLRIPPRSFGAFAAEYFALFDDKGNRPDQNGDRGSEYRNLVGIPGGKSSPLAKELVAASQANGDKLDFAFGKGDDPDARAVTFVMDTAAYPFYQAEVYHQFHDGFKFDENYPSSYNDLGRRLLKAGRVVDQGCPNGMLGIGVAGL